MTTNGIAPDAVLIGFPETAVLAHQVASRLGLSCQIAELHRFPDGESLVRLAGAPRRAIILRSMDRPNDKLVELAFLAATLRDRGTTRIDLIAPYLAYMRQDMEFRPGEVVSQTVMGRWLASLFDGVVTVEPHLHRTDDLTHVFPGKPAVALFGGELLGRWARQELGAGPLVIAGPDEEAEPLVSAAAAAAGAIGVCGRKIRRGDHDVSVTMPDGIDLQGRNVLLIDDMVSSGGTLVQLAGALRAKGANRMVAAIVHALYPPETAQRFAAAGIEMVVSADGVPHPSNTVSIADLLVEGLRRLG